MRVLLIKTSSMGDLIHTLPALTDAAAAIPGIQFDWMVEPSFAEIPTWHPAVSRVIPVALRRWRKEWLSKKTRTEWRALRKELSDTNYDLILDAQGLLKSAVLGFLAKGPRAGLDFKSARESFASFAYQQKHTVNFYQHAIARMRLLFSLALHYPLPTSAPDFGIDQSTFLQTENSAPYLVFLHGTTWASKQWPESYWKQLAGMTANAGYRIKISGGNDEELARASRIAEGNSAVDVMPRLSISAMASLLSHAKAAIAVDTGFGHLAAAMNLPTVSIYGPTNPEYTGAIGEKSIHLTPVFPCAPCLNRVCTYKKPSEVTPACYTKIPPARVWGALKTLINHP